MQKFHILIGSEDFVECKKNYFTIILITKGTSSSNKLTKKNELLLFMSSIILRLHKIRASYLSETSWR
ncbi:hypothetical protein BBC0244_004190 [Bartonella apihabitans]|nr:hypothetical protein BBC0244_004190 [Bartonella apihabitans]